MNDIKKTILHCPTCHKDESQLTRIQSGDYYGDSEDTFVCFDCRTTISEYEMEKEEIRFTNEEQDKIDEEKERCKPIARCLSFSDAIDAHIQELASSINKSIWENK